VFVCIISHNAYSFQQKIPQRYQDLIFENIEIKRDVIYGSNTSQGGRLVELTMDIYSPAEDTLKNRPVIILAHGGYYLNGCKEDFSRDCLSLAKSGYVAVSINYRLVDVKESPGVYKRATADAVNDTKAVVRFFRKDFEHENLYRTDTSNIYIGGYSAGAITSLHYAYATTPRDVHSIGGHLLVLYMSAHGGIHGDSGNPGYSSHVKGVLNISGSIHLANMIDEDEPILFSIHGTADEVVPFNVGKSGYSWVRTEGSGLVHQRADEVGLLNKLVALKDADHASYFYCDSCQTEMRKFVFENLNQK
jgi:para-nitrobenzyl esterase